MKIPKNNNTISYTAVFMTLVYAFTTRSIFAKFLFQYKFQLLFIYGLIYSCLIISFINAFDSNKNHLYAPKGFYSISILFIVIALGLYITRNYFGLLYYGLALLIPFSINKQIIESDSIAKFIMFMALFFTIGCFINFLFPSLFKTVFLPLYSVSAQQSLFEVEKLSGSSTYFAGFTSQVGYTSFFISIGVGCVFCFRETLFNNNWRVLLVAMLGGLLLTGKRGPLVFLLVALCSIYFAEGYGRERLVRVTKIVGILILAYITLLIVADLTKIDGIVRIYNAIYEFLTSGSVEDVGRNQLYEQALKYFRDNPIFGIGWSNFKNMYIFRSTHVHCIYLQLLCETGLIGFFIFLVFFLTRLYRTITLVINNGYSNSRLESSWIKFSLFIQLYFLLYGITGNPLYDIEETIIYFFAIGISYIPLSTFGKDYRRD